VLTRLQAPPYEALAPLLPRGAAVDPEITAQVRAILEDVRVAGDAAVRAHTLRLDGVDLPPERWEVSGDEQSAAVERVPEAVHAALAAAIERVRAYGIAGVDITPTSFTPIASTDGKYSGITLQGLHMRVTDRERADPTKLAVALLAALRAVHPDQFQFRAANFDRLATGPELRAALETGRSPQDIWNGWEQDLVRFRGTREKYLIY